jgi:peptidoglycan/LPS O-acetylase OafA/YrhL
MTTNHQYRPDVDGLRAIAVLSVVLFHVDARLLPGGFVGVDIFFVISGFLISRNILEELGRGRFSLVDFYRRRVKRIAPPLLVVVGVTLLASQALMLPDDAEPAAASALWSLLSLANVYFWLHTDTSYFAAASHDQPLLHLWSLGVEEQFYILWPLLLLLVHRLRAGLFVGTAIVAIASFALGEVLFSSAPSFSYYMLPTRAGELLLGGLVALASLRGVERHIPRGAVLPLALVGAALMIAPLFMLSGDSVFPGVLAVPPTLGTALVILAGHCRMTGVSRVLSLKPMVWIGLLSYSAYLWHWPLLAFYRYGGRPDIGVTAGAVLMALTFLLAWLTYLFVEQPARRSNAPAPQIFTRQYIVPAGVLGVLALVALRLDGYVLRTGEYREQLAAARETTRAAYRYDYVCQREHVTPHDVNNPKCVVGPAAAPNAILWGDSNAAHYIGVVGTFAQARGFSFRNLAVSACPPIFSEPATFVKPRRIADCRAATDITRATVEQYPVVIVSASYTAYVYLDDTFFEKFYDTLGKLASDGHLVIIVAKAPVFETYDRRCREKALGYPLMDCAPFSVSPDATVTAANEQLRAFAERTPNVEYFDVTEYLCRSGQCSPFDGDHPLYYDDSHLSMPASWDLGARIMRKGGVPASFGQVAGWSRGMPTFTSR